MARSRGREGGGMGGGGGISGSIPAFPTSLYWVYIGIMENELEAVVIIGFIRGNFPHEQS